MLGPHRTLYTCHRHLLFTTLLLFSAALLLAAGNAGAFFPDPASLTGRARPVFEQKDKALLVTLNRQPHDQPLSLYPMPPVDSIPTTRPVYKALRGQVIHKESLENSLYANINLRRTIEEYLKIRQRAKELLGDLSPVPYSATPLLENSPAEQIFSELSKRLQGITEEYHGLVSRAGSIVTATASVRNGENQPLAPATSSPAPPTATGRQFAVNSFFRDFAAQQTTTANSYTTSQAERPRRRSSDYAEDITLPWIIRAPLDLFRYIASHTVESLIYGAIALVAISIISAMRNK